jgi:alpha-methylacyl-CoA racemase
VFFEDEGVSQPRPAPRFSRTDAQVQRPSARVGAHTDEILTSFGFAADEIGAPRSEKAVA